MSAHVYLHIYVMRVGLITDSRMTITALGRLSVDSHVTISASLIWGERGSPMSKHYVGVQMASL